MDHVHIDSKEEKKLELEESDRERYWSSKARKKNIESFSTDPYWHEGYTFTDWPGLWPPTRSKLVGLTPQDIFEIRKSREKISELLEDKGLHVSQQTLILEQVEEWNLVNLELLTNSDDSDSD